MRFITLRFMMLLGSSLLVPCVGVADGCYLCQGGGYVEFTGEDTFAKRREAKEKFACVVQGTTSTCSRPKGSVGALSEPRPVVTEVRALRRPPRS